MSTHYNFSIKHISSALDKDFIAALKIYSDTTPTVIATNTNELASWVSFDKNDCFVPMQFALKFNDAVVGYAFVAYIKSTKVAIIDYVALEDAFRLNTIFLAFVNLLQSYVRGKTQSKYFVVEISNRGNGKMLDRESLLFRKLLCLEGFCKVDYKYSTPQFGLENPETSLEAYLYVQSNDSVHSMKKETFIQIVSSIQSYYTQWFGRFLTPIELQAYEKILHNWFENIKKTAIATEGDVLPFNCPLLSDGIEKTHGYIAPTPFKKKKVLIFFALLILILPIIIIVIYNFILSRLDIPIGQVSVLIGAIISAGVTGVVAIAINLTSRKKS
jgi:hypothetical protein